MWQSELLVCLCPRDRSLRDKWINLLVNYIPNEWFYREKSYVLTVTVEDPFSRYLRINLCKPQLLSNPNLFETGSLKPPESFQADCYRVELATHLYCLSLQVAWVMIHTNCGGYRRHLHFYFRILFFFQLRFIVGNQNNNLIVYPNRTRTHYSTLLTTTHHLFSHR